MLERTKGRCCGVLLQLILSQVRLTLQGLIYIYEGLERSKFRATSWTQEERITRLIPQGLEEWIGSRQSTPSIGSLPPSGAKCMCESAPVTGLQRFSLQLTPWVGCRIEYMALKELE
jgi:hypothetical protein